jgi:hypothetical protein
VPISSVKIGKRTASLKRPKNPLDTASAKRGRGRPRRVRPSEIQGRGDHYRLIFDQVWESLWPLLSKAQREEDVIKAVEEGARPYAQQFVPSLSNLLLKVLREKKFPKRREAQINFLADSLAGVGWITQRYSRDICQKERAKQKRAHYIIRYEVYVECSCGYKGLSRNHACPKCEVEIDFGFAPLFAALS